MGPNGSLKLDAGNDNVLELVGQSVLLYRTRGDVIDPCASQPGPGKCVSASAPR